MSRNRTTLSAQEVQKLVCLLTLRVPFEHCWLSLVQLFSSYIYADVVTPMGIKHSHLTYLVSLCAASGIVFCLTVESDVTVCFEDRRQLLLHRPKILWGTCGSTLSVPFLEWSDSSVWRVHAAVRCRHKSFSLKYCES